MAVRKLHTWAPMTSSVPVLDDLITVMSSVQDQRLKSPAVGLWYEDTVEKHQGNVC
jgi:hypothetical protein